MRRKQTADTLVALCHDILTYLPCLRKVLFFISVEESSLCIPTTHELQRARDALQESILLMKASRGSCKVFVEVAILPTDPRWFSENSAPVKEREIDATERLRELCFGVETS